MVYTRAQFLCWLLISHRALANNGEWMTRSGNWQGCAAVYCFLFHLDKMACYHQAHIRATQFIQSPVVDFSHWEICIIDASEQGPPKTLSSMTDDYWYLLRPINAQCSLGMFNCHPLIWSTVCTGLLKDQLPCECVLRKLCISVSFFIPGTFPPDQEFILCHQELVTLTTKF